MVFYMVFFKQLFFLPGRNTDAVDAVPVADYFQPLLNRLRTKISDYFLPVVTCVNRSIFFFSWFRNFLRHTSQIIWKSVFSAILITESSNCPAVEKLPSFHKQDLLLGGVIFWQQIQNHLPDGEKNILSVFFGVFDGVLHDFFNAILVCNFQKTAPVLLSKDVIERKKSLHRNTPPSKYALEEVS